MLPVATLTTLTETVPALGMKLLLNIGRGLAQRLRQANDEIRTLEG